MKEGTYYLRAWDLYQAALLPRQLVLSIRSTPTVAAGFLQYGDTAITRGANV